MRRVGWLAVLAGCQAAFGLRDVGKPIDAPPGCTSFSTLIDTCALPPPAMWSDQLVLGSDGSYDVRSHLLDGVTPTYAIVTTPTGPIDVLLAHSVLVASGATFVLDGPVNGNAVAIVSDGAIEVDGKVSVGYGGAGTRGPLTCSSSGGTGAAGASGGGGGGGGGFRGSGGGGSPGNAGGAEAAAGDGGGAMPLPGGLVGGCRGGSGGNGDTTTGGAAGAGGDAGGAIALITATSVTIAVGGGVNASGGGGGGGRGTGGGGGGGGAGGMIWLEADTLDVFGTVAANGGGGGEGAGTTNGSAGMSAGLGPGPAAGGSGGATNGGDGGSGSELASPDGHAATDLRLGGGGGGGGGAGFIVLIARTAMNITGLVSPPATPMP